MQAKSMFSFDIGYSKTDWQGNVKHHPEFWAWKNQEARRPNIDIKPIRFQSERICVESLV